MVTTKQIKEVFTTAGYPQCPHPDQYPNCNHCLEVKQIDENIFTAEVDHDLDHEQEDMVLEKWTSRLYELGLKVLDKIFNDSEAGQWHGSVWILREIKK